MHTTGKIEDRVFGMTGQLPPLPIITRESKEFDLLSVSVEGAEVANGFYVLGAGDRDEAVKLASMIPASTVQLRQLAGISGL